MPPTTLTPPDWAVRELADGLAMTACHEMGHVLGARVAGLPLRRVWVDYEHDPSLQMEWSVVGRTELVSDGDDGLTQGDGEQGVVMIMAGLEAEAHWMVERHGGYVASWRDRVWDRPLYREPDGDIAELEECLRDADRSKTYFLYRVAELVDEHWRELRAAAAELEHRHELSAEEIDGLLPAIPVWRLG